MAPVFYEFSSTAKPIIYGVEGLILRGDERAFFKETNPLGFILFARNIDNPDQVKALIDDLKNTVGLNCPVLVDQEGGRVQRLMEPHWTKFPPMRHYAEMRHEKGMDVALEALDMDMEMLAQEVARLGFNVNCTPVLDVPVPGAHDVIGDRAFDTDPDIVARFGLHVCDAMLSNGVTPVMKHIPGHGRATADSHKDLPVVDADYEELQELDFAPFRDLSELPQAENVWGMTAHIRYSAFMDDKPCSISSYLVNEVIRNHIGFDGVLLSDDVFMEALTPYGDVPERGRLCLEAGCDAILHCHGDVSAMEAAAREVGQLSEKAIKRLQNATKTRTLAA